QLGHALQTSGEFEHLVRLARGTQTLNVTPSGKRGVALNAGQPRQGRQGADAPLLVGELRLDLEALGVQASCRGEVGFGCCSAAEGGVGEQMERRPESRIVPKLLSDGTTLFEQVERRRVVPLAVRQMTRRLECTGPSYRLARDAG